MSLALDSHVEPFHPLLPVLTTFLRIIAVLCNQRRNHHNNDLRGFMRKLKRLLETL